MQLTLLIISILMFSLDIIFKKTYKSMAKILEVFGLISLFAYGTYFDTNLNGSIYFIISIMIFPILAFEDVVEGNILSIVLKILGAAFMFLLGSSDPIDMFKLIFSLVLLRVPLVNILWNLSNDLQIWFLGTTDYFFDIPMRWIIKKTRSNQAELMVFLYALFFILGVTGLVSIYFNV